MNLKTKAWMSTSTRVVGTFLGLSSDGTVAHVQPWAGSAVRVPVVDDALRAKLSDLRVGSKVTFESRGFRVDGGLNRLPVIEVYANATEEAKAHPEPKIGLTKAQQRALENLFR